jgi:hypothetical protein
MRSIQHVQGENPGAESRPRVGGINWDEDIFLGETERVDP